MQRKFYDEVYPQLAPGTADMVTVSSVGAKNTGQHVTILDGVAPRP